MHESRVGVIFPSTGIVLQFRRCRREVGELDGCNARDTARLISVFEIVVIVLDQFVSKMETELNSRVNSRVIDRAPGSRYSAIR